MVAHLHHLFHVEAARWRLVPFKFQHVALSSLKISLAVADRRQDSLRGLNLMEVSANLGLRHRSGVEALRLVIIRRLELLLVSGDDWLLNEAPFLKKFIQILQLLLLLVAQGPDDNLVLNRQSRNYFLSSVFRGPLHAHERVGFGAQLLGEVVLLRPECFVTVLDVSAIISRVKVLSCLEQDFHWPVAVAALRVVLNDALRHTGCLGDPPDWVDIAVLELTRIYHILPELLQTDQLVFDESRRILRRP